MKNQKENHLLTNKIVSQCKKCYSSANTNVAVLLVLTESPLRKSLFYMNQRNLHWSAFLRSIGLAFFECSRTLEALQISLSEATTQTSNTQLACNGNIIHLSLGSFFISASPTAASSFYNLLLAITKRLIFTRVLKVQWPLKVSQNVQTHCNKSIRKKFYNNETVKLRVARVRSFVTGDNCECAMCALQLFKKEPKMFSLILTGQRVEKRKQKSNLSEVIRMKDYESRYTILLLLTRPDV